VIKIKKKAYRCYSCGCRILHRKVEWYLNHPYCKPCKRAVEKFGTSDKSLSELQDEFLGDLERKKHRYVSKYKSSRRSQ